jgi:PTH1 family peptidyl-tRNA hydrolase
MSADRRIVVGLGNPGEKYRFTRHNIAWLIFDAFADRVKWKGGGKERDASAVHAGRVLGLDLVMAKPMTYMNDSGIAVRKLLATERVPVEQLLVVVDDFSIPFGSLRFRERGSDGGHNGLASIEAELGSDQYPRLRVGIGDPRESGTAQQHVLSEFSAAERLRLPEISAAAGEAIETWARLGLNKAATAFNGWKLPEPESGSAADPASLPAAGEVGGPAGSDGIRKTAHGWRKPLGEGDRRDSER